MSTRPVSLPSTHLLRWQGRTLVYRPSEATVQWGSPAKTGEKEPWRSPDRFEPRCLTVAFRGRCTLACSYCYGNHTDHPAPDTPSAASLPALAAAGRLVAAACRKLGLPLLVGFHGASEPLGDRAYVEAAIAVLQKVSGEHGLPLRLACTTNGVLAPDTVEWLAATFSSITVSLDGTRSIHDAHRPTGSGDGTYDRAAETLHRLLTSATQPEDIAIRSTITRHNAARQVEMVEHFVQRFPVDRLLFHPVYHPEGARTAAPNLLKADPETFIAGFIAARQVARRSGVDLVLASSRVGEDHGRFCPILQHNLTLTPGGHATACFLALNDASVSDQRFFFGSYDERSDRLVLDSQRLAELLAATGSIPSRCRSCFNVLHCARGCPDRCPLSLYPALQEPPGEPCRIAHQVAYATLLEAAGIELTERDIAEIARSTLTLEAS